MIDYSIIIPHYNSSESCGKLISSVSDKPNIEIIIIDDKSKNEELENLKLKLKSKKGNIKLLFNKTIRKGGGAARNIGIKKAIGKWLIFADSDDFFLEGAFDKIESYKNDESDIVYFLTTSIIKDTEIKSNRHREFNEKLIKYSKGEKDVLLPYAPWSKIIKKSLIDKYDIKFEEVVAANDAFFSVKSNYYAKKIKVVKEKVYCITKSLNSVSENNSKKSFYSRFYEEIKIDKFLKSRGKNKQRKTFLRKIVSGYRYGLKEEIKILKLIRKNGCKILTLDLLEYLSIKHVSRFLKKQLKKLITKNRI